MVLTTGEFVHKLAASIDRVARSQRTTVHPSPEGVTQCAGSAKCVPGSARLHARPNRKQDP